MLFTFLLLSCKDSGISTAQVINLIIGDISFETRFGVMPDKHSDNRLRIQTHLAYVEEMLRHVEVSHLSEALQCKRNNALNLLHDYWLAGVFPKNYDYPDQRKPCFIDRDGAICAVGYLVEQTAGRAVAEYINKLYSYDELLDMHNPILDLWIQNSGFTKLELASIQPMYQQEPISRGHMASSAVYTGVNVGMSVLNTFQMAVGSSHGVVPVIGLVSGAGQLVLGLSTFPGGYSNYRTENRRYLSLLNIGMGTFSMFMSTWNIGYQRKREKSLTNWDITRIATPLQCRVMALSMTRRF